MKVEILAGTAKSEAEILKIINKIGKLESDKKKDYKFGCNRVG